MQNSFSQRRFSAEGRIISDRAFYLAIGGFLLFGFLINALEVIFLADFFAGWNPLVFVIVYFVMALSGCIINLVSRNPALNFVGYCLVVLPLGAVLAIALPAYSMQTVTSAFLVATFLALFMIIIALVYPKAFSSVFALLGLALLVALIYQIVAVFTGFGNNVVLDWVLVLVFSGYVGFDVSFARSRPRTMSNAISSACAIYMDLVYVFIKLVEILGRNN